MKRDLFRAVVAIAALSALPDMGEAAQISEGRPGRCDIRISGIVNSGDDAAVEQLVAELKTDRQIVLCLDSPGGSLSAALKIAQLVHDIGAATYLDRGANCESACSIIFFMGTRDVGGTAVIDRRIAAGGRVGIHAPAINLDRDQSFTGSDVMRAFDVALEAAGSITTLGQEADGRSGDNWIPVEVVNHLLTTPYDKMFHVTQIGQAQDWNIEIADLRWPDDLSNAYLWNTCNYGVRERMGWSHAAAIEEFDTFRADLDAAPVILARRHLVGQGTTQVTETFTVVSGYQTSGLRFGCSIDVDYPVVDREGYELSVCVTVLPETARSAPIRCDSPNDRLTILSPIAGYAAGARIDALDKALPAMAATGLPGRQDAD